MTTSSSKQLTPLINVLKPGSPTSSNKLVIARMASFLRTILSSRIYSRRSTVRSNDQSKPISLVVKAIVDA